MNILLIEDDPGIGRFVRRGLTAEGYAVEWQTSARRAIPRLASGLFSAAILDLGLPDMDGTDLCCEVRAAGIDTPICMLTARATLEEKLEGFRCGADDYLAKPFAFEELLARLAVLVRRGEATNSRMIAVGEMRIDIGARTVTIAGQMLDLPRREFEVLLFLARHAGQAVSREQLLNGAWGADADITENAVDVYVGYLRRRLAGFATEVRVTTVRGIGFRLDHGTKA